jgi:hypothetical protein
MNLKEHDTGWLPASERTTQNRCSPGCAKYMTHSGESQQSYEILSSPHIGTSETTSMRNITC